MTQVQPGWYADPGDPGRWRWYDGQAWTEHVSAPVEPAAPAPPSAPVAGAAAYGTAPAYGSAQPYGSAPAYGAGGYGAAQVVAPPVARARAGTSPTRILVIVGITLAGITALGLMMSVAGDGLRAFGGEATAAPGPRTVFLSSAPATVDGLPASAAADLRAPLDQMRTGGDVGARMMGGTGGTQGQAYASRGQRIAFVTWTTIPKPVAQKSVVLGIRAAWVKERATDVVEYPEADGATLVCSSIPRTDGLPATMCSWVRSGSGIVQVVEIGGGGPAEIAVVTREVVQGLSSTT
jgi:hypothetical protein